MTATMFQNVQIVLLIVVPVGLLLACLRFPRWFSLSLARHAIWRVRDSIADDMIAGRLPSNHPAVRELLEQVEWFARESNRFTMLRLHVLSRAWKKCHSDTKAAVKARRASLAGLTPEAKRLLEAYRKDFRLLSISTFLFGTWLGILNIVRFAIPAMIEARRRAKAARQTSPSLELRATVRMAATRATTDTWIGRRSGEFLEREREEHLAGLA